MGSFSSSLETIEGVVARLFLAHKDYESYKKLFRFRFDIFNSELGWQGIPPPSALSVMKPSHFKRNGVYVSVENSKAQIVGMGRGLPLVEERYGHWAFKDHLLHEIVRPFSKHLWSITDVAVDSKSRGKYITYKGLRMTIGQLIVYVLCERVFLNDVSLVFGSVQLHGSVNFSLNLGCYLLNSPFKYHDAPSPIVNIVFVLPNKKRYDQLGSPLAAFQVGETDNIHGLASHFNAIHEKVIPCVKWTSKLRPRV